MNKNIFIVDIDGTICDSNARVKEMCEKAGCEMTGDSISKMWNDDNLKEFYAEEKILKDGTIIGSKRLLDLAKVYSAEIRFLTGRNERFREVTNKWIYLRFGLDGNSLHMRPPEWEFKSVAEFKEWMFLKIHNPGVNYFFFDDDEKCLEKYSKYGKTFKAPQCWDLNDEEKLNIFKKYLDLIKTESIKEFVEYCIINLPEYFWTLPASTSGKYHGGELLLKHVLGCLFVGERVLEQMASCWSQKQKDQFISALILHDGWRAGDNEKYSDKDNKPDKIGELKSSKIHPQIGFKKIIKLGSDYNLDAEENQIELCDLEDIAVAVEHHMGPWTISDDVLLSDILCLPYNSVVVQVHNVDFHQTHNASWRKND